MPYTTVAACKAYLGLTVTDDDALLTTLIDAAQAMIEGYCGRVFEAAGDTTRRFHAVKDVDGRNLYLDHDLASVTSVTNGDGLIIPPALYRLLPANYSPKYAIELLTDSDMMWTFTDSPENAIAVTGRWAFSVVPPADVVYGTLRLVAYLYRQKDTSADSERAMVSGDGVMVMPSRIPADVKDLLFRYRRLAL